MPVKAAILLIALAAPVIANAGYITGITPGSIRVIGPSGSAALIPVGTSVASGCGSSDFYVITAANSAKMMLGVLLTAKFYGEDHQDLRIR